MLPCFSGFFGLAGHITLDFAFFPIAAVLLGAGFCLALWNLGRTLWAARPLPLPAHFVVVGLFSIGATVVFGTVFALVLGSVTTYPHFVDATAVAVPIHVIAGLGGWMTFTAMGVSYRLLAMFMLAPELKGASTRRAFYCGTAALFVAIPGGLTVIFIGGSLTVVLAASGLLGLCAFLLCGLDILHLYRSRRRRTIELNSRMAAVALGNLVAVTILIAVLVGVGTLSRHAGAIVFLASFGWLSGLGLSKLYKIVPFLTWLECYGPVLGKTATPRVQDLVVEARALKWFVLYFLAVWGATAALFLDHPLAFRFGAAVMVTATGGIIVQLVRARRWSMWQQLYGCPPARTPRLLYSWIQHA